MSKYIDIKIIIGNERTGKTKLLNKYTNNIFDDAYKQTILFEYGYKINLKDGKLYRFQLLEIAGNDENYGMTKKFATYALGCIIMSDATNIKTREE